MKRYTKLTCIMLTIALLLVMTGCAGNSNLVPHDLSDTASNAITLDEPQSSNETVMGYISTEIETPKWVNSFDRSDTIGNFFHIVAYTNDGGLAVASYDTLNNTWQRYDIITEPAIYPGVELFSATESSFWLVLREHYTNAEISSDNLSRPLNYYLVYIDTETGEQACTYLSWDENQPYYMALIAIDKGRALLSDGETTYLLNPMAEVIGNPSLEIMGSGTHVYVNGEMYVASFDGLTNLNRDTLQYTDKIIPIRDQPVYSSSLGHFLTTKDSVLYSVSSSGEETELFSWMSVSLSYSRLYGGKGLENSNGDIFHLTDRVTKVSKGPVPVKKTLVLACFGDTSDQDYSFANNSYVCSDKLKDAILRFNNSDPEYRVEIKPYIYNDENERSKMLMSIATGNGIDLIDTSLLPDGAIDKQLLVDLLPYIDADDTVSRNDFIPTLLSSMMKDGGLYEYVDKYTILTMFTHPEIVGDNSWTVQNIEQYIKQYPELKMPTSQDHLVRLFSWAATAEFIDRANSTCNFDSPTFASWLSLLKFIIESSDNYNSGTYFCGISYDFAKSVGFRARLTMRGDYLTVGFPDAEGNGSYFLKLGKPGISGSNGHLADELDMYTLGAATSVGIIASSPSRDGAWRFLRTFIYGEETPNLRKGIPVLKESFEQAIQTELARDTSQENLPYANFTATDADILREIVYGTDKVVCTDEAVIDIIARAIIPYLEGKGTADDAAQQIQSKMSVYLAEQG